MTDQDIAMDENRALNHINLEVADVKANAEFFIRHFGFKQIGEGLGGKVAILTDGAGMAFAISNLGGVDHVDYPKWFHVGFTQRDDATVDAIHARLKAEGVDVGERKEFHNAWTFYTRAPGGYLVEVFHQRNQRA